jgi:hypothetical protein
MDTGLHLKSGEYHYSIPIEACKSLEALEEWLPVGYDAFFFELGFPDAFPLTAAFIDLFENINEVVDYETDRVHGSADAYQRSRGRRMPFNDLKHGRNIQKLITKTPAAIPDKPHVNDRFEVGNPERFKFVEVTPKRTFKQYSKKVIAVGSFPAEFWDMFSDLTYYGADYPTFMEAYKAQDYDIAVIGGRDENKTIKISTIPEPPRQVITYDPAIFERNLGSNYHGELCNFPHMRQAGCVECDLNYFGVYDVIKTQPVGTDVCPEGYCYSAFNNKYWVRKVFSEQSVVKREGNKIVCNGWVLPEHLINDGYLEV